MSLPKEPRQKMINIMYLVLTALLALNVSSEILNAFRTVNNSLDNSNAIIADKNNTIFKSLAEKLSDPKTHEKAAIWMPKANAAKDLSEGTFSYIQSIIDKITQASTEKGEFNAGELEVPTRIMINEKEGDKLYEALKQYKAKLLAIDPLVAAQFKNTLPLDLSMPKVQDKSNNTWPLAYFHMTPSIAAITILKKFQNDVRNSESQVVEFLHNQVGAVQLIYDQFAAIAYPNSTNLLPGQPLTITAGVGAFSAQAKPTITIDGATVPMGPDGVAEYKATAGGVGHYKRHVTISFVKNDGTPAKVDKDIEYDVLPPSDVSVSADAVKVLYVGLGNPITVAGGDSKSAPSVSISQGRVENKGNGHFMAFVTAPGTATINVTSNGKTTPFQFRVKRVPPPILAVGRNYGGAIGVNEFKAQRSVRAELKDFLFEGVKYEVVSYVITFAGAGYPNFEYKEVSGSSLGPVRSLIERAESGSTIVIDNVRVKGPNGVEDYPGNMAFNLQD